MHHSHQLLDKARECYALARRATCAASREDWIALGARFETAYVQRSERAPELPAELADGPLFAWAG